MEEFVGELIDIIQHFGILDDALGLLSQQGAIDQVLERFHTQTIDVIAHLASLCRVAIGGQELGNFLEVFLGGDDEVMIGDDLVADTCDRSPGGLDGAVFSLGGPVGGLLHCGAHDLNVSGGGGRPRRGCPRRGRRFHAAGGRSWLERKQGRHACGTGRREGGG